MIETARPSNLSGSPARSFKTVDEIDKRVEEFAELNDEVYDKIHNKSVVYIGRGLNANIVGKDAAKRGRRP